MRESNRLCLLLAGVALALNGCAGKPSSPDSPAAAVVTDLVLVTTSDFHAALDRAEPLAETLRALKAEHGPKMLYLDAGGMFQGTLEGNLSKGRPMVELFNLAGLDATAVGNHEFDYGMAELKARVGESRFKWLSANHLLEKSGRCQPLKDERCNALGEKTVFEPRVKFERGGVKACVIGATSPATPHLTRAEFLKGTRFSAPRKVVEAEARFAREKLGCDLVILTAHLGLMCTPDGRCRREGDRAEMRALLMALPEGTIDVAVAGRTHALTLERFKGTPVIQAGTGGRHVGVLKLARAPVAEGGRWVVVHDEFVALSETASSPDVSAALKPYRNSAGTVKNRVVGEAKSEFARGYWEENALGNLVADALRESGHERAQAEFALVNAGAIRKGFGAGKITYGDVFNAVPYESSLAVAEVTGAQLKQLVEIALSGGHGLAALSGLRVKRLDVKPGEYGSWSRDLNGDGQKDEWENATVLEITDEQGRPIEDGRRYKLATLDFLTSGGDHGKFVYKSVPAARKRVFADVWVRDVVVGFLTRRQTVQPEEFYSHAKPRLSLVQTPAR